MFKKASELIKYTKNESAHAENEKAKSVLNSFCQLNNITL